MSFKITTPVDVKSKPAAMRVRPHYHCNCEFCYFQSLKLKPMMFMNRYKSFSSKLKVIQDKWLGTSHAKCLFAVLVCRV